jgi:hypothetical protein
MPMERKPPEQHDTELAKAIMIYLAEQARPVPLEEIAAWWLTRRPLRVDVNVVARAVRKLTEEGLLEGVGEGRSRRYQMKRPDGNHD